MAIKVILPDQKNTPSNRGVFDLFYSLLREVFRGRNPCQDKMENSTAFWADTQVCPYDRVAN